MTHQTIARFRQLNTRLAAHGWPEISPWWDEQLDRFYAGGWREFILRVGRRGGKSSTLARILVVEALYGEHYVPPGDVGKVAIISVRREEANDRLTQITKILNAIGVEWLPLHGGANLVKHPRQFQVFTANIGAVVGGTVIAGLCDEEAYWRDERTGKNPATEILANLRPAMAGQKNAKLFHSSAPLGMLDAHAKAFALGENKRQTTAWAPTWVARPALTEDECAVLEPDEDIRRRVYGAVPIEGDVQSLFTAALLDLCTRDGGDMAPVPGWSYAAAIDPATRGNAWTLVVSTQDGSGRMVVAITREWRGSSRAPLDAEIVLDEIAGILRPYGTNVVETDQWSGDALTVIARQKGLVLRQRTLSGVDKLELSQELAKRMSVRGVEIPNDKQLRADLLNALRTVTSNGVGFSLLSVDGRHADYVPSLLLVSGAFVAAPPAPLDPRPEWRQQQDAALVEARRKYGTAKKHDASGRPLTWWNRRIG